MIDVELVNVDILVESREVRVVAMQPFIRLESVAEPFRWKDEAIDAQLNAICHTLDVSQGVDEGEAAAFTLFPEYSIPGLRGAIIIDERVSAETWPNNTVIIAGFHGLTKSEYSDVCEQLGATVSERNGPDRVPNGQWVNCCLTWVKDNNDKYGMK